MRRRASARTSSLPGSAACGGRQPQRDGPPVVAVLREIHRPALAVRQQLLHVVAGPEQPPAQIRRRLEDRRRPGLRRLRQHRLVGRQRVQRPAARSLSGITCSCNHRGSTEGAPTAAPPSMPHHPHTKHVVKRPHPSRRLPRDRQIYHCWQYPRVSWNVATGEPRLTSLALTRAGTLVSQNGMHQPSAEGSHCSSSRHIAQRRTRRRRTWSPRRSTDRRPRRGP
jgi:hypothetical protein